MHQYYFISCSQYATLVQDVTNRWNCTCLLGKGYMWTLNFSNLKLKSIN